MVLRLLPTPVLRQGQRKGPRRRGPGESELAAPVTFSLSMGKGLPVADDNTCDPGARVVGRRGVWPRRPFRFPDVRGGAAPRVWPHGSPDERGGGGTGGRGGGTGGRFIGGCVGLDERARAKEGMMPGTTSSSDAERSHEGTRRAWREALARTSAEAGEPVCYHTLSF